MRLTRNIQQWEIETYNPTRPNDDKFINSDYMCKKSAYDRDILNKLGELEDIEEELGIDLITLFKALKNGIWFEDCNEIIFTDDNRVCITNDALFIPAYEMWLDFKDYGKTWALNEKELL